MTHLREWRWHTVVRVTVGRSWALIILVYGADPYRGKTCVLYVVEVLPNTVPGSAAPTGNEKELYEGRERRSTRSGPRDCKRLDPHQLGVHNGR